MKKRLLPYLLSPLLWAACHPTLTPEGGALSVRPVVEGAYETRATVPDDPARMEDDLSGGMDLYLSGDGLFLKYRLSAPDNGGIHYVTSQWRDAGVVPGRTYDLYAVANSFRPSTEVNSLEELQALLEGPDADIYRLYDPSAATYDLALTRQKHFLMDGRAEWTPDESLEQVVEITLHRAAAKIEVDFSLSPGLSNYHIAAKPQWKLVNYATLAQVLPGGSPMPSQQAVTPLLMDVTTWDAAGGTITTYSYPRLWTDPDDALCIILNVPLAEAGGETLGDNYYCLPVVDPVGTLPYRIERNTLYRVSVVLDAIGSSGENATDLPLQLLYRVLPWAYDAVTDDISLVGREIEYLMVDPLQDELREKVLAGQQAARTRHLHFWSSGPVVCSAPEVYYFDKNGTRIDASLLSPVTVGVTGLKNGTVDVTSRALDNNAVKYIRFRVSLADNPAIYEEIRIEHYPLDYIKNIEALWSSLTTDNWVDWRTDQELHTPQRTVSNNLFPAKVYASGAIYRINEQRSGSYYRAVRGSAISGLSNNRMYIVQITSSSDSYSVGRVTLDGYFQSQEHLVSPAFMIASQLGASQTTTNGRTAAAHCGSYMEVTASGEAYTGWRLPTREEIGIIMGYQYDSDAIDEVLSGAHYWTLEGKAVSKTDFSNPASDGSSGYIRCVRDLTVAELKRINSQ